MCKYKVAYAHLKHIKCENQYGLKQCLFPFTIKIFHWFHEVHVNKQVKKITHADVKDHWAPI